MSTTNQGILTLVVPQMMEDELVDFFLDSEHQHGFTSLQARGHSSQHGGLSLIEQVTGRKQQVQFEILVNESQARDICKRLESTFSGSGIHYWFLSTLYQGRI
jgi:hypothetical protein